MTAAEALEIMVSESRKAKDSVAWGVAVMRASKAAPEDILFFVEGVSAAAATIAAEVARQSELPRCSFCLKTSAQVEKMVSAPNANICSECSEVVHKQLSQRQPGPLFRMLSGKSRTRRKD